MAAPQVAAHAGLAHGRVGSLPRPGAPAQLVADFAQDGPDAREDATLTPALAVPVHGAVVAKLLRQLMPWAARAQAKDHAIESPAQIDTAMALGLGGVDLVENGRDDGPYVVRHFPNRRLSCGVHDNPPCLCNPGELSSGYAF
jgi:hypothetical protein